jgi:hypothetical protein
MPRLSFPPNPFECSSVWGKHVLYLISTICILKNPRVQIIELRWPPISMRWENIFIVKPIHLKVQVEIKYFLFFWPNKTNHFSYQWKNSLKIYQSHTNVG